MSLVHGKGSAQWRAALLVGAVSFFSFSYFYEGGGWNQNSRFDLLRAIVEQHTLRIDAYHENTRDKAHFQGHYYSDKAPGVVFLAVPVALAVRPVLRVTGVDPASARGEWALSYLVSAFTIALPMALAGVCLFFLGLRFGCGVNASSFGAMAVSIGSPIWAYANLFWAHALVGACIVFAFAAAVRLGDRSSVDDRAPEFGLGLVVGLAAGWATVTEYPAAPVSALLALFALAQVWNRGSAARWRVLAGVAAGAMACIAVLMGYLHAAFGAFRPSYAYYDPNSFSFMQQQGYMGLTYPHPDRLLKLLFGCSRGLVLASPVMVAGAVGLWWLKSKSRGATIVAGAIVAYYFLFHSSFYWWKAGLTFGPRYAGASIPLLGLGLAVAWSRAGGRWRWVLAVLGLAGVVIALMVVSTSSELSMQDSCPLVHMTWPAFWAGKMAMNRESMLTVTEASSGSYGAFNLGQLAGLRGLWSLLPLLAAWAGAVVAWVRWVDHSE